MRIHCDCRYLAFPVNESAPEMLLTLSLDGQTVYDLKVNLDVQTPQYTAYVDISRFHGQSLELSYSPECDFLPVKGNTRYDGQELYGEALRPLVHFTPARGWMNDPNGLVYANGQYHLFFQHNPAGVQWNNMHWGHAVSTDLFHWEERDVALFSDELGTVFSGGGWIDKDNRAGLGEGAMLLYYTSAAGFTPHSQGKRFTQSLAYSMDGVSFTHYSGNPIIGHIADENRDPKPVYHAASDTFILPLYLNGRTYALYSSKNLLDWTELQRLELPEDDECPDFYPLPYGECEKWVFSGAHDRYLIGSFDGQKFTPEYDFGQFHYGSNSYASQSYANGKPGDARKIRISWNTSPLPDMPFRSSMTTPVELTLKDFGGKPFLCVYPVDEIKGLYVRTEEYFGVCSPLNIKLDSPANDISLKFCENGGDFMLKVCGTSVEVSQSKGILSVGGASAPLEFFGGHADVRIISDVHALEVYINSGKAYMCCAALADRDTPSLQVSGDTSGVGQLTVSPLRSIQKPRVGL